MCSCIVRIAFRRSRLWQLKLRTVQMALKLVMVSTHPLTTPKSNRAIGDGVVPLSQYYRVHSDSHIRTLRLDWKDTGAQKCRSPPRAAPGNNVAARPRSCPASRLAVHKGHYGPEMRVARCSRIYKPVTSCRVCPGPPGYQAAKNSCRIWHGSERTVSCGSLRVRRPSDVGPLIEGHGNM